LGKLIFILTQNFKDLKRFFNIAAFRGVRSFSRHKDVYTSNIYSHALDENAHVCSGTCLGPLGNNVSRSVYDNNQGAKIITDSLQVKNDFRF
jgi:hypothetical protein